MSNEIHELELKLAEAKKLKIKKSLNDKLKQAKKNIGIGFATHSLSTYFTGGRPAFDFHMFYVHDAIMKGDDEINYVVSVIDFAKTGEDYRMNISKENYYSEVPYYLGATRYPVTLEQLNHFKDSFIPKLETAMDELRFDYKAGLHISQGDHQNVRNSYNLLKDLGHTFMDMNGHDRTKELLKWNNHPFLFNNFLLISKDSFKLIENIANKLHENASIWGGSILSRDLPRIKTLKDFYNKYKHLGNEIRSDS